MTDATPPGSQASSPTIRDELSEDAQRLTQTATGQIEQAADGGKQQATTAARAVSSAIGKAAGALRDDDKAPAWLTTAFEKTAQQVGDLAKTVEGKDIAEMRRGVTQFARQSPVAFLAASAAAGFAAARFLRAGSEYQAHQDEGRQSFSGGGQGSGSGTGSPGSSFATGGAAGGGSSMGAVGAAAGSDLGSSGGSTSAAGADQSVWSPASAPLDREGAMS